MSSAGNPARITAIDGYRAIAITVVMLHHSVVTPGAPNWLPGVMSLVPQCVVAFWVLSGFLITRSLLREEQRTGAIQFRRFYARQAIRFFVPLIGYLLPLGLFITLRYPAFNWWMVVRPLVLDPSTFCIAEGVAHLYSMVLQIYFWLAWPIVLALVPRRFRLPIALLLATAGVAWRTVGPMLNPFGCMGRIDYFFGPLFVGACFALAEPSLKALLAKSQVRSSVFAIGAAVAVAILILANASAQLPGSTTIQLISRAATFAAWGWVVFALANNLVPTLSRALSLPGLTWLGRISFSVYLWQNLFCVGLSDTVFDRFPLNLLAALSCGYVAYRLVELPSLRWRSTIKAKSALSPEVVPTLEKT
jgi:peptidoglycan/LPS O-acetylase OafA/YrhL